MKVFWFNPENDLALAAGNACYTPPAAARRLQQAGELLPLWYGDPGDLVLCRGVNARWFDDIRARMALPTDVIGAGLPRLVATAAPEPRPWGWSAYTRRCLAADGFTPALLPTADAIEQMRLLSHRRTALRIYGLLRDGLGPDAPLTPPGAEARTPDEARALLAASPAAMVKAPWSSSGRGVTDTRLVSPAKALAAADDAIRRQGSVIIEPAWDKALDFARLYECRDGECHDLGVSLFTTDSRGAYRGNVLAPPAVREARVDALLPEGLQQRVADCLRGIIAREIAPAYTGILGVDMLVTADGRLDAVVEINLRHTMGYVANRFAERYLQPGATGEFRVLPAASPAQAATPAVTEAGRLVSGTLQLVPPNPHFRIEAEAF